MTSYGPNYLNMGPMGYENFFRQKSGVVEGIFELKQSSTSDWEEAHIIFSENTLTFHEVLGDGSLGRKRYDVPMNAVDTIRTDPKQGDKAVVIRLVSPSEEFHLRAQTKDELQQLLFAYQKAVALQLSQMLQTLSMSALADIDNNENSRSLLKPRYELKLPSVREEVHTTLRSLDDMELHRNNKEKEGSNSTYSAKIRPINHIHSIQDFSSISSQDHQFNQSHYQTHTHNTSGSHRSWEEKSKTSKHSHTQIHHTQPSYRSNHAVTRYSDPTPTSSPNPDNLYNFSPNLSPNRTSSGRHRFQYDSKAVFNSSSMAPRQDISDTNHGMNNSHRSSGVNGDGISISPMDDALFSMDDDTTEDTSNGSFQEFRPNYDMNMSSLSFPQYDHLNVHSNQPLQLDKPVSNNGSSHPGSSGDALINSSYDGATTSSVSNSSTKPRKNPVVTWQCGVHSKKKDDANKRNEDRYTTVDSADVISSGSAKRNLGFFAVYDGHGGDKAAEILKNDLHARIFNHAGFDEDRNSAIHDCCRAIDQQFIEMKLMCGSTAVGAVIDGDDGSLVVFNIGDSHAVLSRRREAVDMSVGHKPERSDERSRIEEANGWLEESRELQINIIMQVAASLNDPEVREMAQRMEQSNNYSRTIYKVVGDLSVSRAFGDCFYKGTDPTQELVGPDWDILFWPDGHSRMFSSDLIISTPEFCSLSLEAGDEFLIIASDGLWDVVPSDLAVNRIHRQLVLGNMTLDECAESLCLLARRLGSTDDVTVIIVKFAFI